MRSDDPADALAFEIGHALRRSGVLNAGSDRYEAARQVIAHLRGAVGGLAGRA